MRLLRRFFNRWMVNPPAFFAVVLAVTFFQAALVLRVLHFELGRLYPYIWFAGFVILAFNISLIFTQAVYASLVEEPILPEEPAEKIRGIRTALLVCVKNEDDEALERIRYTLRGNFGEGVHFWLLSDSGPDYVEKEKGWLEKLNEEFGQEKIFYRRRPVPFERKQGHLAIWFEEHGRDYDYLFVSDADSSIPEGTLRKLIRKAEHPRNRDIGSFQSAIYIVHDHSLFARAGAIGQFYAQRLYFRVNQAVFGRTISFGHNCLVRSGAFRTLRLPSAVLSHDNWDTALMDRAGYRTAFVTDTLTFEEATQNYLEERARAKRWMKGSLQGWPILFMSGISFTTRYYIFYQIYLYLMHPILLAWILIGLIYGSEWVKVSLFTKGGPEGMRPLVSVLLFMVLVLYGHKFLLSRSLSDLKRIAFEVAVSTLVSLNNIFYITWDLFTLPFEKLHWRPMAKNPNQRVSLAACTHSLFVGTLFGAVTLLWGLLYSPYWVLTGFPILGSLIASIPTVYLTSKNLVLRGVRGRVRLKERR